MGGLNITFFADMLNGLQVCQLLARYLNCSPQCSIGDWYFNEVTALFLISTIVITAIYYKEFKKRVFSQLIHLSTVWRYLASCFDYCSGNRCSVVMTQRWSGTWSSAGRWSFWRKMLMAVLLVCYIFILLANVVYRSVIIRFGSNLPVIAPIADLVGSKQEVMVTTLRQRLAWSTWWLQLSHRWWVDWRWLASYRDKRSQLQLWRYLLLSALQLLLQFSGTVAYG